MPRLRVLVVLLATAALAGCGSTDLAGRQAPAAAPAAISSPATDGRPAFGVNGGPWALLRRHQPEQVAELLERAGATVLRLEVPWFTVQTEQPAPGTAPTFHFGQYAAWRTALARHGIRPLLLIGSTPSWALRPGVLCPAGAASCDGPPATAHLADFEAYVRATVRAFPEAVGMEVFNEPNNAVNWAPRADPAGYVRVLRAAHRAAHDVRPSLPVVTAGPVNGAQGHPGDLDAPDWLTQLYRHGARGAFDGIGLHPYPATADPAAPGGPWLARIGAARRIAAAHGDGDVPIWITESGYPTGGTPAWTTVVSEREQARLESCAYRLLLGRRSDDTAVVLHNLVFDTLPPASTGSLEDHWGLARADGTPKPIVAAMGAMLRGSPRAAGTCGQRR